MQASKIRIGEIYATRMRDRGLVRFRVQALVSIKTQNSANATTYARGSIEDDYENRKEGEEVMRHDIEVSAIEGHYKEFVDLQEQHIAAQKEKARLEQEERELMLSVWRGMHELVSQPVPPDGMRSELFHTRYGNAVEISKAALPLVAAALAAILK